jgi:hypothetical protein
MSDEKEVAIAHHWQGRAIPLDVLREVAALEDQAKKQMARAEKAEAELAAERCTLIPVCYACASRISIMVTKRAAGRESGRPKG